MANLRVQRRRGRRGDGGASLVEFAFVMPLLFMLLLGTLTSGLTLSRQNSVKNAVREGTRLGAIYPIDATDPAPYLRTVLQQTIDAATGDLDPGAADRFICVAYISDSNIGTRITTDIEPNVEAGTCPLPVPDTRTEERVQVLARRTSEIGFLFATLKPNLQSHSVTRYER